MKKNAERIYGKTNPKRTQSNPNKANFQKAKMNVNSLITKDYRKNDAFAVRKNKAKTKPISERPKMNANVFVTKDYRKNDAFAVQKNKPNSNPISVKAKMNVSLFATKDYGNETTLRLEQNKPNQSQFQTRSEFIPKGAEIPTGELLGILKPGTNFKAKKMPDSGQ